MLDHPFTCRLCGGSRLESLGRISAGDYFAGQVLPEPIPGGRLWRCLDCESLVRHPILTSSKYQELYEEGAAEQWSGDGGRMDLAAVRSAVLSHPGAARVLDIGCGSGDFLQSLPGAIAKFGVEPGQGAGSEAAKRGVTVVAPTLEELPVEARFDVVTIVDVIEHIVEPAAFLTKAFAHLAEGGLLVVSSGDPQNFAWRRVFRSRFWYSSFPEHISFPSRRFYERWMRQRGAELVSVTSTRYRTLPPWKSVLFLLIQGVYWLSPRLLDWTGRGFGMLAGSARPRRQHFSPGVGGLFTDHWVVAIRRIS